MRSVSISTPLSAMRSVSAQPPSSPACQFMRVCGELLSNLYLFLLLQDKRNPQAVLYAGTLLNWSVENEMESRDSQERFLKSSQTIFLMLGRLKLPALRCFCTWLADPCRARPLEERLEVGEISTFSLSIPARERRYVTTESSPSVHSCLLSLLRSNDVFNNLDLLLNITSL